MWDLYAGIFRFCDILKSGTDIPYAVYDAVSVRAAGKSSGLLFPDGAGNPAFAGWKADLDGCGPDADANVSGSLLFL